MSSTISLPRKKFSSDNAKLYKSLGSLIKEYRQWRKISQETFAESIKISVRELQNWEANRRRVRIENLHDISEFTGIPMQALVALNAEQPGWYSLRKRLFTYSLIEKVQFSSHELFRPGETPEDHSLLKTVTITTEKQMDMILSCHRDLYGTKISLKKDVIMTAAETLPEQNSIIVDHWGHYVAHKVCLPIKTDIYQALIKQKTLENYLTSEMISDIIALGEGVFFLYSTFAANAIVSSLMTLDGIRGFSKIKRKEKFLIASHTVTKESEIIQKNLKMRFVRSYGQLHDEVCPTIDDIKLDFLLRLDGPFGWMIEPVAKKAMNLIRETQQPLLPGFSVQDSDKLRHPNKSFHPTKISENKLPIIVDALPSIVDEKKRNRQDGKAQDIKPPIEACTNPKCTLYGNTEKSNIVSNGTYQTKKGTPGRRFLCKECGKSFCSRTGTIFYDIRSPEEKVLMALKLLAKGRPLQHVVEFLGVKFHTVRHWLEVAALQSEKINAMLINEPDISLADLDAFWAFVKTKSLRQKALLYRSKIKPCTTD